jgi:N4-gp56 family major capsid protein
MANDANVFKISSTGASYITPVEWSEAIEQVAREKNICRGLTESIIEVNREGVPGNTFNISKNAAFTAAALTDGNSATIQAVSFTQIQVSAQQVVAAVQITLKQLRDELSTVRGDVIQNLGTALAEKMETDILTELYTTTSTVLYANNKLTGTITSTDTFNVALLVDGKAAMRVAKRNARYLIVHPNQYGALSKLQQFTDASQFGGREVTREGFIGRFLGVDVYESVNIVSGTENSTTVYRALLLGERAAVLLIKKGATLDIDRNLIQDLSMTMVAYQDYGVQILNDESIRVLRSA